MIPPIAADWSNIQERFNDDFNTYTYEELGAQPMVTRCTQLRGCDVTTVGNGICNMECMFAQCKWDGGDCGGAPGPQALAFRDPSLRAECTLSPSDINGVPYQSEMNLWEECNGVGNCTVVAPGLGYCSCDNCQLKPGVNVTEPGPKCINCLPQPKCQAGTCSFQARQFVGLQSRLQTWNGQMYDGTSVFDADRMSGVRHLTPAAQFDVGAMAGTIVPLLQSSCAGELGVTLGNAYLQGGIHAPYLQDMVTFLADWNRNMQACRIRSVDPANAAFNERQLDFRFHPHHAAFWLYQYTWFKYPTLADAPDLGSSLRSQRGAQAQFVHHFRATRTRLPLAASQFGSYLMSDMLNTSWGQREPSPTPSASPTSLAGSKWAQSFRMFPPDDSSGGTCSLDIATSATFADGEPDTAPRITRILTARYTLACPLRSHAASVRLPLDAGGHAFCPHSLAAHRLQDAWRGGDGSVLRRRHRRTPAIHPRPS